MGLGSRLELLRGMAQISARALDRLVGVTEGYSSLIESGVRANVGTDLADRYAHVFGVSLDWLVAGRGTAPSKAAVVGAVAKAGRDA